MDVIKQVRLWNTRNETKDDYPFSLSIFLALTDPEEVSKNTVNENVLQFIVDLMNVRTQNHSSRVEKATNEIRLFLSNATSCS